MGNDLAGKVAIVTGGASGLGEGLARRFCAEGAKVLIGDIDRDAGTALATDLGADALFVEADVSDIDQVSALVSTAVEQFGGLHVMVNNAGVPGTMHRRFLDDDLADFRRVMSINLLAVMAGTRDAARHMSAHGGGSIINLSSIGGIQAGGGVMTYRASKAAVIQFTKCAAIELAHYEIRVNAIAPGNIRTAIVRKSAAGEDREKLEHFEEAIRAQMRDDRPLKREGTAEDVAEAALYFASDRSRYVTGTVLPVDGGTVAGKMIVRRSRSGAAQANGVAGELTDRPS
jgi:NAD(P)-dependent dehydrogenase (short-subunit alcohol dehydrogenase family)